ncbi:hypothetical protein LUZ62_032901 [Rhynchospora pubera]|uniref:WW domain-containing protein n=1 Tax=Rhynchospora pubera TaxID=906938 RepID=A0AAV8C7K0_9POAL|nr:hypothetical protein LUZ62_084927 [Rhynchospora pubera]KAJ4767626.1 hypothetical protein LUZ62_078001 [Rhynchospora pubera]KAJ4820335.1 hypothetical protein LUZ62_032901 [Rhynchospora pubera]
MVSLQTMVSLEKNKQCFDLDLTITSKKRKRDDEDEKDDAASGGLDLHLDIPLPVEWERCLDIKSGQIHYYNTRTHKRTSKDPRASVEKPKPTPMPNLDLELNLTCNSKEYNSSDQPKSNSNSNSNLNSSPNSGLNPNSTDQPEMVATVCMRCHMLVMMCKTTLSCPNCKFVHPPTRNPIGWTKPEFKLLCCKD